jgi:hypothetical protein
MQQQLHQRQQQLLRCVRLVRWRVILVVLVLMVQAFLGIGIATVGLVLVVARLLLR